MGAFVCGQVFEFLIRRHSADSSEEEEVFPFIRTLLHFDTREFLNVLAMVRTIVIIVATRLQMDAIRRVFNRWDDLCAFLKNSFQTFEDFKNDKQALEFQQRIVDILLQAREHGFAL